MKLLHIPKIESALRLKFSYPIQSTVLDQLAKHQCDPKKTSFWEPFVDLPAEFDAETCYKFRRNAEKEIVRSIQPAMKKLASFLTKEYMPHTRPEIGISSLPNGDKFYEQVNQNNKFKKFRL